MKNIIDDGINVFIGLQGVGKSYVVTHKATYELLNPKSKKKVISNYPIIVYVPFTFKQKLTNYILSLYKSDTHTFKIGKKEIILQKQIQEVRCSYIWNKEYTHMGVKDALVIIDESGQDEYSGTYAYELTKEDRKFFSRLRHHNISVFMMSVSPDDIHPFIKRRLAYIHEVSKLKFPWSKKPYKFFINTYTSIKDYLKRDDYKIHKKARKTLFRRESIKFSDLVGNAYNTHYYKDMREEPNYVPWFNNILGQMNEPDIEPTISIKPVSSNVMRDSISTLMRLNHWKKKDATIEVNKIMVEYNVEETDTVEKIIRIALARRAQVLEDDTNEVEAKNTFE